MRKLILLLICTLSLFGADGVTKTSTTTLVATAGTTTCTFSSSTPQQPSGVHAICVQSGTTVLTMDTVIPVGSPNGIVGVFVGGPSSQISWAFTQPTASGPVNYSVTANGQLANGSF